MILIECTSQVALLRLRAQSNSMQDECHGPSEDGEPVEATKRRSDIAGNIDQLHVTKSPSCVHPSHSGAIAISGIAQPESQLCSSASSTAACGLRVRMYSTMPNRPPGRKRRRASATTSRLSGAWHRLSIAQTTSKLASGKLVEV